MVIMQTVGRGGSAMNVTDRFTGRERLTNTEKKKSGLIDGLLKATPFANFVNRVAIAQQNSIGLSIIG